jgi:hypothetical protein
MATSAKASKGTLIKSGDGAGLEVFATIGEVLSFSGPGEAVDTINVTSFDSVAKEYISDGLVDGGEVTFEVNFIGSNTKQQALRTDLRAGTVRNFKVIVNDHATEGSRTTFSFAATVTNLDGPSAGQSEQYKMSVTLKVSGLPTVAYAT